MSFTRAHNLDSCHSERASAREESAFRFSAARTWAGHKPALTFSSSRALQIFQHFLRMTIGFHVVEYVRDFSLRPNHKRRAGDPLHYLAIHIFVFDHTEGLADLLVFIRQ